MKKLLVLVTLIFFTLGGAVSVLASVGNSRAEAISLVNNALNYIKANGKEKALAEFNNPNGEFVKGDLYIFAYDFQGTNKALAPKPELVGKNLIDMQDADGKFIIKDLIALAEKGSGWYKYKWENPNTKKVQDKASYVVKVDDDLWLGCGIYLD